MRLSLIHILKDAATASYGKKGEKIVAMNHAAIEQGMERVVKVEVPASWATATDEATEAGAIEGRPELVDYITNILEPINAQRGDSLPVSTFKDCADGTVPLGSSAYEKRGIAVDVPTWNPDNCIQCNFCLLYTSRCV